MTNKKKVILKLLCFLLRAHGQGQKDRQTDRHIFFAFLLKHHLHVTKR